MNPLPQTSTETWREWDIPYWNAALFQHYFASGQANAPVRRFAATAQEMKRVAGSTTASPSDVLQHFVKAFRKALSASQKSLCSDALSRPWDPHNVRSGAIPPFFAHLLLTCFAAAVSGPDGQPEGNFRRRMKRLLGRDVKGAARLSKLPELWKTIRDWLAAARREGMPYRELVLPEPGHRKLIGHSYWLSFPPHRDRLRLRQLFSDRSVLSSQAFDRVGETLESHAAEFTPGFRQELEKFVEAVRTGESSEVEEHPFWLAIIDSLPASATRRVVGVNAILRLDLDNDRHFSLTVLVEREHRSDVGELLVQPAGEFAVGEHQFFLDVSDPDQISLAHQLLRRSPQYLTIISTRSSLFKSLRWRVLLFTVSKDGSWVSTHSCRQDREDIRALVAEQSGSSFALALREAGARPIVTPSLYPGWVEVRRFQGRHLVAAASTELGMMPTVRRLIGLKSLPLRGGVRLQDGWLGRKGCLPTIVASRGAVTLWPCGSVGGGASIPLECHSDSPHVWHIPDTNYQGAFVLRAGAGDEDFACRRLTFRPCGDGHHFRPVQRLERWFREGATDNVENPAQEQTPELSGLGSVSGMLPQADSTGDISPAVATLVEVFSGLVCRRRGIEERDVYAWIDRLLGARGRLARDIARAWVEHGSFDRLTSHRWRRNLYVARPPRLVLIGQSTGSIGRIVLQGLIPEVTRERVSRAAERLGGKLLTLGTSDWVPPIWTVHLPKIESIEDVIQHAKLSPSLIVRPSRIQLSSVESIASRTSQLRRHHRPVGTWDWSMGHFRREARVGVGVEVERYRRTDVPDAFVVWRDGEPIWHGLSMTWAVLVGAWARGDQPFVSGDTDSFSRLGGRGLYLPLAVGRLASLLGSEPPGPVQTAEGMSYVYRLGSQLQRNLIRDTLWPSSLSASLLRQMGWLAVCLKGMSAEPLVPIPQTVTALLQSYKSVPVAAELARYLRIPRRLLPYIYNLFGRLPKV